MSISRLTHITRIGVEQMGDLADRLKDPEVLRLENLETDLRPPPSALDYTKRAVDSIYLAYVFLRPRHFAEGGAPNRRRPRLRRLAV